jgi:hypothetical protein
VLFTFSGNENTNGIENYRYQCGYFFEYAASSLSEIVPIVNRKFQTLSYYGYEIREFETLIKSSSLRGSIGLFRSEKRWIFL